MNVFKNPMEDVVIDLSGEDDCCKREREVIDLTAAAEEAEEAAERRRKAARPTGPRVTNESEAPWKSMKGEKRILAELKHAQKLAGSGKLPCEGLRAVGDDVRVWQFELSNFDEDSKGGRALNEDLKRLQQSSKHGGRITMEVRFPDDYPQQPFKLRVVSPRMCLYTGHVTAGGSVCLQALAPSSSWGGWTPDYCFSGLLPMVIDAFINCEETYVRTQTGPGGRTGPLRVALDDKACTKPYSLAEAEAGFNRALQHHLRNGW